MAQKSATTKERENTFVNEENNRYGWINLDIVLDNKTDKTITVSYHGPYETRNSYVLSGASTEIYDGLPPRDREIGLLLGDILPDGSKSIRDELTYDYIESPYNPSSSVLMTIAVDGKGVSDEIWLRKYWSVAANKMDLTYTLTVTDELLASLPDSPPVIPSRQPAESAPLVGTWRLVHQYRTIKFGDKIDDTEGINGKVKESESILLTVRKDGTGHGSEIDINSTERERIEFDFTWSLWDLFWIRPKTKTEKANQVYITFQLGGGYVIEEVTAKKLVLEAEESLLITGGVGRKGTSSEEQFYRYTFEKVE
jgi:hypothetical protein